MLGFGDLVLAQQSTAELDLRDAQVDVVRALRLTEHRHGLAKVWLRGRVILFRHVRAADVRQRRSDQVMLARLHGLANLGHADVVRTRLGRAIERQVHGPQFVQRRRDSGMRWTKHVFLNFERLP